MNKTIVVEAGKSEKSYWKDIWTYRELFYVFSVARRYVLQKNRKEILRRHLIYKL